MATRPTAAASAEEPREPDSTAAPRWQTMVSAIGPKLRELRRELGLSLQQLAGMSDVSAAAIHKIERSDMVPTITTLLKLAAAVDRPVGYFIDEDASDPVSAVHTPAGERRVTAARASGVELADLSGLPERSRLKGSFATIPPGKSASEWSTGQSGEELVFVLDGSVDFTVGERQFALKTGDALHYTYLAACMYAWKNTGDTPATMVWVRFPDA